MNSDTKSSAVVPTGPTTDRRTFLKTAGVAGVGVALSASLLADATKPSGHRRRYAIVGTGSRHQMYQDAIQKSYAAHSELVGLCDTNLGRLKLAQKRSQANGSSVPAGYLHADFDKMIAETKPDVVIVTTVDSAHHEYIVRAMKLGCDVLTEKPMTNTPKRCQQVLDARKRTGRHCRVTFNLRYSPPRTQVKDILMSGEIGDVLSIDFQWMLNTFHGADYFRRWHSQKKYSNGLMLHKATHHFDLVNWWLAAMPVSVYGVGKREFYTPEMAQRLGLRSHHERCLTCPESGQCGFFLNLAADPLMKEMYLDQEKYDGYIRDRCVFRPDIDIEDAMNLVVKYDNGACMSYSLNAFSAWEGYQIVFNGTKGRLEHSTAESIYVNGTGAIQGGIEKGGIATRVIPLRGAPRAIKPWEGVGSHGGGDSAMLDDLFLPEPPPDKYLRAADERAGAASLLVGAAANRSFSTGRPVEINDLIKGLTRPDYAPMPSRTAPIPMPLAKKK
jgi:predicted dehydrogenase